jgi:hypothetical protein
VAAPPLIPVLVQGRVSLFPLVLSGLYYLYLIFLFLFLVFVILVEQLVLPFIKTFKTINGTNMAPFGSRPAAPSGRQALLR